MGKNGTSDFIGCTEWAWHGEPRPRFVTPDDPGKRRKQGDRGLRPRQKADLGKLCFSVVGVTVHMIISRNIVYVFASTRDDNRDCDMDLGRDYIV